MNFHKLRLLTIVTESALESTLVADIEKLGARGYTVTNARGNGSRGVRSGDWGASSNIRMEIVCDAKTEEAIACHLKERYYKNYAMILFGTDVDVMRSGKFSS